MIPKPQSEFRRVLANQRESSYMYQSIEKEMRECDQPYQNPNSLASEPECS